jgi:hypothetical protein
MIMMHFDRTAKVRIRAKKIPHHWGIAFKYFRQKRLPRRSVGQAQFHIINLSKPIQVRQEHHEADKTDGQEECFRCFAKMERMEDLFHNRIFLG